MRVRATIDVTQPLCRGRRIVFDEDSVGWITFQCERLPNMLYVLLVWTANPRRQRLRDMAEEQGDSVGG